MAQLELSFLGPFQAWLNGQHITGFESNKVRALLTFLTVESDRPHSREYLAGVLWPDWPERAARSNLRYALSNLRQGIGDRQASPPFLLISRNTIQFNLASDHTLDVATFASLTTGTSLAQLERAATLYQGEFLTGFSLSDSGPFEEWALLKREQLGRRMMKALDRLVQEYAGMRNHERAQTYAWRLVELEPLYEQGHQLLMRALAQGGQRGAALLQYKACRGILDEELGVEPVPETTALYERIRDGQLESPSTVADRPQDLGPKPAAELPWEEAHVAERLIFVARDREMVKLGEFLDGALAGAGRVVFVTGGAGRGKTALMREFALRSMTEHHDLIVLLGGCNAFSGAGDPYLPFREMMDTLVGDSAVHRTGNVLSRRHAEGLWAALPLVVDLLLDHGPHLVNILVNGTALLSRAAIAGVPASLLARLRETVTRRQTAPAGSDQGQIFHQFASMLRALAAKRPLLLLLDDLQWADTASINLLFHLGRALAHADHRTLVICAYRPEAVAVGRPAERENGQSVHRVLMEIKRRSGDVWVDLARTDEARGRDFVDALLDAEPNRLGEDFRRNLYEHTGGHPLFTVELLGALKVRANLVRDAQGYWVVDAEPDWLRFPAKVEAVIEDRVARLDEGLREILATASVEGERFTAQVIGRVRNLPERDVLRALSHDLGKRHRLVREMGETRAEDRIVSHYQFSHALFQSYIYGGLSAGERRVLHGEVANALVRLYGDQTEDIVAHLAHHYAAAGQPERAIVYSLRAGSKALVAHAYQEARAHYELVLRLLQSPDSPAVDEVQERRFVALMGLGQVGLATGGVAEARRCADDAIELGKALGVPSRELLRARFLLGEALWWQNQYDEMKHNAQEGLALLANDAVFSESCITDQGAESAAGVLMMSHLAIANWWTGNLRIPRALYPRIGRIVLGLPYTSEFRATFSQLVEWYATVNRDIDESGRWLQIYRDNTTEYQDLHGLEEALWFASRNAYSTGDLHGALELIQAALELGYELGDGKFIAEGHALAAGIYVTLGDLCQADSHFEKGFESARDVGRKDDLAWLYWCSGMLSSGRRDWTSAVGALRKAIEYFEASQQRVMVAVATNDLARAQLAQGDTDEARELFTDALLLAGPVAWRVGYVAPACPLVGLETLTGDPDAFRGFVQRFNSDHPEVGSPGFRNWYLQVAEPRVVARNLIDEAFSEGLSGEWVWEDPLDNGSFTIANGIEVCAANGSDLWLVNQSAPRLLRPAPEKQEWFVQTICEVVSPEKPAIGGLLLWGDGMNYLWLSIGRWGEGEICFGGCLENNDLIIGRGTLNPVMRETDRKPVRTVLRLERTKGCVSALCSVDGETWFSVGVAELPVIESLRVGFHAIGYIDRAIYHGAYPDGTAIRFRSFQLGPE